MAAVFKVNQSINQVIGAACHYHQTSGKQ